MNRLQKCELAKQKGFSYDELTGKIFSIKNKECKRLRNGYISFSICSGGKEYNLYGHIFAWYCKYNIIVDFLDHKNNIRTDNAIDNLRSVTRVQNSFNKIDTKGYSFDKSRDKYVAVIQCNGKRKYLGRFKKEEDAKNAYLQAKKIYHVI